MSWLQIIPRLLSALAASGVNCLLVVSQKSLGSYNAVVVVVAPSFHYLIPFISTSEFDLLGNPHLRLADCMAEKGRLG